MFRTFVTGRLPTLGGGGKPQRIVSMMRSPSLLMRTIAVGIPPNYVAHLGSSVTRNWRRAPKM